VTPAQFASALVEHDIDRLALLGLLSLTLFTAHRLRSGPRALVAQDLWLGSAGLLGSTAIWLVWAGLAALLHIPAQMWSAPLDRLVGLTGIVTLGWLTTTGLGSTGQGPLGPHWRRLLASGFGLMLLTYLVWAPQWAMAFNDTARVSIQATQQAQSTVMDVRPLWDASQSILALLVVAAIALVRPRVPRLLTSIVGLMLLTSAMDLAAPINDPSFRPIWSRMGALAGGLALAGSAGGQVWALRKANAREEDEDAATSPQSPSRGASAFGTAAPAAAPSAGYGLPDVLSALHSQTIQLSLLADRVDGLGERMARLEGAGDSAERSAGGSPDSPESEHSELESPEEFAAGGPSDPNALAARLEQYESVLGYLSLGVLLTDASGRIAFGNRAATQLLGRDLPLRGQSLAEAMGASEALHAGLRRVIEGRGGAAVQDLAASQHGRDMDAETGAVPIAVPLDRSGLQVDLFGLRPNGELSSILAVLRPREGAGPAAALVPQLAEALRAPVASILGYSHLLRQGTAMAESQVQRYLERIDANLARMQVTLESVATVLRGEHATAASLATIELPSLVDDAFERARHQFEEKGLGAERALDPRLQPFAGRPEALAQILDNLLLAAARRSPQGGDLRLEAGLQDAPGGQAVLISVHDRGPAIGKDSALDLRIEDESLGLELRMVALLAGHHGGRAWVENHALGSCCRVALPV
jgi:signal transduction histidine kinase